MWTKREGTGFRIWPERGTWDANSEKKALGVNH